MTDAAAPGPRFGRTPHLVRLLAEVTELVERLEAGTPDPMVVEDTRDRALLATLRLDGSPATQLPGDEEIEALGLPPVADQPVPRGHGSWYTSLTAMQEIPDEHLLALEARGAAAAMAADDLVGTILTDPLDTLAELHTRLTVGLVTPDRAGTPRETEQAVHDATIGRILYFTVDPAAVRAELAALADWLRGPGSVAHGLITAGILHLELLRIHPFDAANGRLARAAARLALRAAGLDPAGLSAPEIALAADPLGYHQEVAGSLRRRDASIWLERWGDAVVSGLRDAARRLDRADGAVADLARAFLTDRGDAASFTVRDYQEYAGGDTAQADADLTALLEAGRISRIPGSRGLRFRVL